MEVDVSKPLKWNLSMLEMVWFIVCIIDDENITNICYGCGSQKHKFDFCKLNTKSVSFRIKKLQEQGAEGDPTKK